MGFGIECDSDVFIQSVQNLNDSFGNDRKLGVLTDVMLKDFIMVGRKDMVPQWPACRSWWHHSLSSYHVESGKHVLRQQSQFSFIPERIDKVLVHELDEHFPFLLLGGLLLVQERLASNQEITFVEGESIYSHWQQGYLQEGTLGPLLFSLVLKIVLYVSASQILTLERQS